MSSQLKKYGDYISNRWILETPWIQGNYIKGRSHLLLVTHVNNIYIDRKNKDYLALTLTVWLDIIRTDLNQVNGWQPMVTAGCIVNSIIHNI